MGIETIATVVAVIGSVASIAKDFGGGPKAPTVQTSAPASLADSSNSTAQRTAALLATQGGSAGDVLQPGTTGGKDTILGN